MLTTSWGLIQAAQKTGSPEAQSALAALCEAYWLPVYHFTRHSGFQSDEARDLTQAFFTRLIERDYLAAATPDRGRFRSFLLTSVRHFLSNERARERAQKRGGNVLHSSLDATEREPSQTDYRSMGSPSPEHIFERRWALAVLDMAMKELAREYHQSGRGDLFASLTPFLVEPENRGAYERVANDVGMSPGALRVAVHRLRRRFGVCVRTSIASTVGNDGDVEDELSYLLEVLTR